MAKAQIREIAHTPENCPLSRHVLTHLTGVTKESCKSKMGWVQWGLLIVSVVVLGAASSAVYTSRAALETAEIKAQAAIDLADIKTTRVKQDADRQSAVIRDDMKSLQDCVHKLDMTIATTVVQTQQFQAGMREDVNEIKETLKVKHP